MYKNWIISRPFDIGATTQEALGPLEKADKSLTRVAKFRAFMNNRDSASNGCMMRSTPLAVWASGLSQDEFKKASVAETQLTHPNPTPNDATYLYNLGIKFLLNNKDDPNRA